MKGISIGISAGSQIPEELFRKVDFIEIKKITGEEASLFASITSKPIYFHLQYSGSGEYLLPSVTDFSDHIEDFFSAYDKVSPSYISFHFGLSSRKVLIDKQKYWAVAQGPLLSQEEIISNIEKNLNIVKSTFPVSTVLLENLEYIPEALCGGAYRFIQEANFFTENVKRWTDMGILDGIVFDIAHGLITSGNHPYYNGMADSGTCTDPLLTTHRYIRKLEAMSDKSLLDCFTRYIGQMPMDLVKEIHISGISRKGGVFVDTHNEMSDTEMKALEILSGYIRDNDEHTIPVTLEYSRDPQKIPFLIDTLKSTCREILYKRAPIEPRSSP